MSLEAAAALMCKLGCLTVLVQSNALANVPTDLKGKYHHSWFQIKQLQSLIYLENRTLSIELGIQRMHVVPEKAKHDGQYLVESQSESNSALCLAGATKKSNQIRSNFFS